MINICIASVGGKGEYLAADIITTAVIKAGFDVRSIINGGVNSRNGSTTVKIKIGENVISPEIAEGTLDILLGFELLEAYRMSYLMKKNGIIILSNYKIYPAVVIAEREAYPDYIYEVLASEYTVIPVDFYEIKSELLPKHISENFNLRDAKEFIPRAILMSNNYTIGVLARILYKYIPYNCWVEAIKERNPNLVIRENLVAFNRGYYLSYS